MAITSRKTQKPCIYWISDTCVANQYFPESTISCFNEGNCDGFGTCQECSRFDPSGLKLSTLSKSDVESDSPKYDQTPINVHLYNLRAKVSKCCKWNGPAIDLSMTAAGTVLPVLGASNTKCTEPQAADWQKPYTPGSKNLSIFPCNGAKADCPFYTGPKFEYLKDEKMEIGQPVTAAQIMELRYYSRDWSKEPNPRKAYEALFSEPDLWPWVGDFDDTANFSDNITPISESLPRVVKVTLFSNTNEANSFIDSLHISAPTISTAGTVIWGGTPTYPTLIKQSGFDKFNTLSIKWPKRTKSDPYIFRTFRYGQNKIYIIVVHNSEFPVYAVNMTKYPQNSMSDRAFVQYMLNIHPDDVSITESSLETIGSIFVVELLYSPDVNEIKIFTEKPQISSDGSMYTDTTYVKHKFYHAHLAQTSFQDKYGQPVVEPWVDRFLNFSARVDIKQLSNNPSTLKDVLWDTVAYDRPTIYELQKVVSDEPVKEWDQIYCDVVAVTVDNINANPVQSWTTISGAATANNAKGKALGIWADRSSNPNSTTSLIEMSVVSKSEDGLYHPANVLFVKTKDGSSVSFDKRYDKFKVSFAYTEYKQGPVPAVEFGDLKYPERFASYNTLMPYEVQVSNNETPVPYFIVEGMSIPVLNDKGEQVIRLDVDSFEATVAEIEKNISDNEKKAIESFISGGTRESEIEAINSSYSDVAKEFSEQFEGMIFQGGKSVTLENLCSLIETAGYYEGTQEYRAVFADEAGRPVGIKRIYLLTQSAVPSCRDVEIYYRWRTQGAFVDPRDHESLLALDYKPMIRSNAIRDFYYVPHCGDHSLQSSGQTFYTKFVDEKEQVDWGTTSAGALQEMVKLSSGDQGPMWYPYKSCSMPRYNENDPFSKSILCFNYVEGFGLGLRRSYWERSRGSDIYWSARVGIQNFIGCTWSWVEGDYQTIKDPVFAGFTRIRSGHLFGPYQTDRESIRLSRHYIKRNLAVRNEWIRTEGYNGSLSLSSDGTNFLFYSDGSPKTDEKPIWIHMFDDVSIVDRTSPLAKHPFSNLLLVKTGGYDVDEQVWTDAGRQYLYSWIGLRDLTKANDRDTSGNLVYRPSEPKYKEPATGAEISNGKDVFWVFNNASQNPEDDPDNSENPDAADLNIEGVMWAWLETKKDIERAFLSTASDEQLRYGSSPSSTILGVQFYPPSVNAFKNDRHSATYPEKGGYLEDHSVTYTAPLFASNGSVIRNPTLQFDGGPPREIDWITGKLLGAPSSYGKDPYNAVNHGPNFVLFGKVTSAGNGFLADNSGIHKFEVDGTVFETMRGIGISPEIKVSLLPYRTDSINLTFNFDIVSLPKSFETSLGGLKETSSIKITYSLGPDTDSVNRVLPQVSLDGKLSSGVWVSNIAYFVAYGPTSSFTSNHTQEIGLSGRYTHVRLNVGAVPSGARLGFSVSPTVYVKTPATRTEYITVKEQRVYISRGNIGNRNSQDLLYYYGRTFADFGLKDVNYDETNNLGPYQQDLKWQSRTVRDVMLHSFFMDPTGTVFDYPKSSVTSIKGIKQFGGSYYVDKPLRLLTKGQTYITSAHVSDPIDARATGTTWSSTVAHDESSSCQNAKSEGILDENLQECLYQSAARLLPGGPITAYQSYWHPDEIDFFVNTAKLSSMPAWTLTLTSTVAPFSRVMRHPGYGCSARYTNEYNDGKIHKIPPWRALGHLLYLGSPVWNWTCLKVIMQKLGVHLGERLFEKDPSTYVSSRIWPPESVTSVRVEKPSFYSENRAYWDNPATYTGGTMSPGIPIRISQVEHYAPGGVPRGWLEELSIFPQTKQWPLGDESTVNGYKK